MMAMLFHLPLLFLWLRVWTGDDRAFVFNPLLTGPMRAVDRVLGVLRAPFPFLPDRALAALALTLALALKALAFPRVPRGLPWFFLQGFHVEVWEFIVFTFQIAAIHAVVRLSSPRTTSRAAQTVELLARPVSFIRPVVWQLPTVLLGIVACTLLVSFLCDLPASLEPAFWEKVRDNWRFYSGLGFVVDILQVWSRCLLLSILISWLSLFNPRNYAASCAREFSNCLLGRLAGLLPVGMMDMTPLVVFMVVNHLHGWLVRMVAN